MTPEATHWLTVPQAKALIHEDSLVDDWIRMGTIPLIDLGPTEPPRIEFHRLVIAYSKLWTEPMNA